MSAPYKIALGFAAGALIGTVAGLGISLLSSLAGAVGPGGAGIAAANLFSLLIGALLSRALGGMAIGRGLRPILGYGLAFILIFALATVSLLTFMSGSLGQLSADVFQSFVLALPVLYALAGLIGGFFLGEGSSGSFASARSFGLGALLAGALTWLATLLSPRLGFYAALAYPILAGGISGRLVGRYLERRP